MTVLSRRSALLAAGALATAGLATSLSSCSKASSPVEATKTNLETSTAEITIWALAGWQKALSAVTERFRNEQGVKVNIAIKDYESLMVEYESVADSSLCPDILVCPNQLIGSLVKKDLIRPIEIGQAKLSFKEVTIHAVSLAGKTYAIPTHLDSLALVRNTALLPKAAPTWAEMLKQASALVSTKKISTPFAMTLADDAQLARKLYQFQSSFGADLFANTYDGSINSNKIGMGSEAGLKFAHWLQASAPLLKLDVASETVVEQFVSQKCPLALVDPIELTDIIGQADPTMKYVVQPVPKVDQLVGMAMVDVYCFVAAKNGTNPVASNKFLTSYLTNSKTQIEFHTVFGYPVALDSADKKLAKSDNLAQFSAVAERGLPTPNIAVSAEIMKIWSRTLATILAKPSEDPAALWEATCKTMQQLVAK